MRELAPASSRVVRVTFFEDRARVEREVVVLAAPGESIVRLPGVSLVVHDPSVSASASASEGTARVLASRVQRLRRSEPEAPLAEVEASEKACVDLRARVAEVERARARAEALLRQQTRIATVFAESLGAVPRAPTDDVAELEATYEDIDGRVTATFDRVADLAQELAVLERDLALAEARLRQAETKTTRYHAEIALVLEASAAGPVTIACTYLLPCAVFRPEHVARLSADGTSITLTTSAVVWQATGESWSGIAARFSTARPARQATCPLLEDDVLVSERRSEPRNQVTIEIRDQEVLKAGIAGVKRPDDLPGVDDGGEPLWFEAQEPCDVPSDGKPVRVEIGARAIPCTNDRVAFPEVGPFVHLRARAASSGAAAILAGPVLVARGDEIVGRSRLPFVGPGEPFELGFGVDDGLRFRRAIKTQKRTTPLTGTQHVKREVTIYAKNTGGEARAVKVAERVPVSEVEAVKIAVSGGRPDADGFVWLDVTLGAGEERTVELEWELEAGSSVVLGVV